MNGNRVSKKMIFTVTLGLLLSLAAAGVHAKAPPIKEPAELKVDGLSTVLLEPTTGEILFQKNADRRLPPASVTKLMVMLLALEAIDKGQIKLGDVITASPEACKMGGSQIWLEPGEQMTVADLLKAICIVSANDASYALGEHIAGSEENFIALMNRRAGQLGLKNTVYVNTTGLEPNQGGEGNITSATDMAQLAKEVVKFPMVFRWSSVWMDSLRGGKSFLRNTNRLVRFYRGCDGLKTGFTNKAGFCLVATAKREGVRLIAVVMNSPTDVSRAKDISKLFNYGFSKYKAVQIYRGGEELGQVKVFRGKQSTISAVVPREFSAVLKREAKGTIVKTVQLDRLASAPVRKGQKIGTVQMTIDGKSCGQIELVAGAEVKRASIFEIWASLFRQVVRAGVN